MVDLSKAQAEAVSLVGTTWTEFHVFTEGGPQLTLPSTLRPLERNACSSLIALFTSREHAFRSGITLFETSFAVHQYETTRGVDLVYGRAGDAVSGAGACVAKAMQSSDRALYVAVIYKFPSLSANAVSKLVDFVNEFLVTGTGS